MVAIPYNTFDPTKAMNVVKDMNATVSKHVTDNKKILFILGTVIIAVIIIVVYLYRYFKNEKERKKKKTIPYAPPCPDYWTDISGDTKTPGICHNPESLGTCRRNSNIHYGDYIYLVNMTNDYVSSADLHNNPKPISVNTDMSYNPNISYMTLSHTISSCDPNMSDITSGDLTCYEKKNILNKISYTKKNPNVHIRHVTGTLDKAESICSGIGEEELPINWNIFIHPDMTNDTVPDERKKQMENKRLSIPKNTQFTCTAASMPCVPDHDGISKAYYKRIRGGYIWQVSPPQVEEIPPAMNCQGIKKTDEDQYALIYGKTAIPQSSLIEGESDDTVWVKSLCKKNPVNKNIKNALIPTKQSIWMLENVSDKETSRPISYYNSDDTFSHKFYIKYINPNTKQTSYTTVCNNNIIRANAPAMYISKPEHCTSEYMSIVSTDMPTDYGSGWIFYKYTDTSTPTFISTNDESPPISSSDIFYIGSMYKYNTTEKRPEYFLGTCGKRKNDSYLQLVHYDDLEQSNNVWTFIVNASKDNNPIISKIDFNTKLGIDIEKNPDIIHKNIYNKKKCEWAKTCDVTWDIIDKMC